MSVQAECKKFKDLFKLAGFGLHADLNRRPETKPKLGAGAAPHGSVSFRPLASPSRRPSPALWHQPRACPHPLSPYSQHEDTSRALPTGDGQARCPGEPTPTACSRECSNSVSKFVRISKKHSVALSSSNPLSNITCRDFYRYVVQYALEGKAL